VAADYTLGVLVQANYGTRESLTIAGVPVGREIEGSERLRGTRPPGDREGSSIIVVVATDAPLMWLPNGDLTPLFDATVESTEEAIANALVAAETMVGINGNTVPALPKDQLRAILKKYNRLVQ
jgi:L-aminopeptidase/D-esterase-like protein